MVDYETEYLSTLSNIQWFAYPFLKTIRTVARKIGCCRDREEDFMKKSNKKTK